MRRSDLRKAFRGVDWSVSTADGLAAPEAAAFGAAPSGQARQWSADLTAVVGEVSPSQQVIVGWPHLQPEGPGSFDSAALDRCDERLDLLMERGVKPGLTLLHVDMPEWVDASGGWLNRDTALRFADLAVVMADRFGDRVDHWTTVSDLLVHSVADYVAGMLPTGRGVGMRGLVALHNVLLGNGLATQAVRSLDGDARVGSAMTLIGGYAASDDLADRLALNHMECWAYRLFLDPLLLGRHMVDENDRSPVEETGCVDAGDMAVISEPTDMLGLVWHVPSRVAAPENLPRLLPVRQCFSALNDANRVLAPLGFVLAPMDAVETTTYGWPVVPEGLADAVAALHDIYGDALPPVRVIDSGMCDLGSAGDPAGALRRRSALAAQLGWLAEVMADGVEIQGYEYWSLADNAAWKLGYTRHYAMAIDARRNPSQPRIPLDWAHQDAFGGRVGFTGKPGKRALHPV
ncbi:family 1 glycosylhydrolase [Actinomadura sp. LOL_016]|uniref:family 1 glycosylhydrolase n=1 Tax=Actinomadura sp. LOL_016 TaxID=3345411 RepID=UPI003A89CE98